MNGTQRDRRWNVAENSTGHRAGAAPWSQDAWVEQDLVISRALVALFSVAAVAERLAFRGARSPGFRRDILPLLRPDPGPDFDIDRALDIVRARLIRTLPGEPWQGVRA